MKIYDGHGHIGLKIGISAEQAIDQLIMELDENPSVAKFVLLAIEKLGIDNKIVEAAARRDNRIVPFCNLHPYDENVLHEMRELKSGGIFRGLKLHPSIQKFSVLDSRTIKVLQLAGELDWPVLIHCYPDRELYAQESTPLAYDNVLPHCPNTKVVLGHMGGYRLFEAFTMAKEYPNLYLDMSLTLLYYRRSSLNMDMEFIIRNMRGKRVLFGTDYPDRGGLKQSVEQSLEELNKMDLEPEWRERVLWQNAFELYGG